MMQTIFSDDDFDENDSSETVPQGKWESVNFDSIQKEIKILEEKIDVLEKEKDRMKAEKKDFQARWEEECKKRDLFLKSYEQLFPGAIPSLGNFENELASFKGEINDLNEKIEKAEQGIEVEKEKLQAKKSQCEKLQEQKEEQEKKQEEEEKENMSVPGGIPKKQAEKKEGGLSRQRVFIDDTGAYWRALAWEEKKEIFVVRDTVLRRMKDGFFDWGKLFRRFEEENGENIFPKGFFGEDSSDEKKERSALLLSIVAHRSGKLQFLKEMMEEEKTKS